MSGMKLSLEGLEREARVFVNTLTPKNEATIVGLFGDLGSGKTTFTQAVARALGVEETVTSPTFVIEKVYPTSSLEDSGLRGASSFKRLIHIDAYRLESGKELLSLGWQSIAADPKNLIIIEWPERVADILPSDMMKLRFAFVDEETREIIYD